ncbi:MAG: PaaI family thioesterase [Bacteroidota bacterium]
MLNPSRTPAFFNQRSIGHFPALIGVEFTHIEEGKLLAKMPVRKEFFAPNGFVHAGSLVTFADTMAGYAAEAHLPEKAKSFTTLELKSNFLRAIREGVVEGICVAEHLGRTTQVWRVDLMDPTNNRKIAIFSCTQLILY